MSALRTLTRVGILSLAATAVKAEDISTFGQGCADVFRTVTTFPDRNCEVDCYDLEWLTNQARSADANGDGQVVALAHGIHNIGAGESERYTMGRVDRLKPVLAGDLTEHGITAQWTQTLDTPSQSGPSTVTIHFADNVDQMRQSGDTYVPAQGTRVSTFGGGICLRR